MTPLEINRAIAEACGWKNLTVGHSGRILGEHNALSSAMWVPDFNSDLNAMQEVEQTLGTHQLARYADFLEKVCVPAHSCLLTPWQSVVMATAAQRAEAFVRTIGKWADSPKEEVV